VNVLAFADQPGIIYQDAGVEQRSTRLENAKQALSRLGSGVDESGLGRGTRLAGALQQAMDRMSSEETVPTIRRMVVVSDGVIEDREACRPLLDVAVNRGIVISVIGVGDDFDEEFLMMMADLARGNYYYAATAPEVEQAVTEELQVVSSVVGRQGHLRLVPENGAILHDVFPVAPQLSEFQAMWVEQGGWRFRIGDISAAQPPEFIVELAAPAHAGGELRLCTVSVEGQSAAESDYFGAEGSIRLFYSDESMLLQARDDEVLDTCRRLEIYRAERRAAEAESHGDQETATKQLKAATRMLRSIGDTKLADEMDAAASDAESGTRNLGRTKRVKAGTRRLGNRSAE
jgi:Ca-activated chloride channel family protein